ncbi:MAG: AAA family ATPase [Candidatus Binatia bacterium]|nr:AAA family ATPase [Candidatus Binatia bacterium]
MSASWNWPGSRWWRVDLHTHSPASNDFKPDADRDAKDWAAWVSAAKSAGLHAVALTDHNTPDGTSDIQTAAVAQGLTVFPGVEVTVGGIHLLCLFDPKGTRDDVVALLSKLGIEPVVFGQHDASSSKSIVEAIELATAAGAVVVAAHVNGPKGLLTMPPGQDRLKSLKASELIAAELAPLPSEPTGWLDPKGTDVQAWLDGTKTEGRGLAQVWCSDSHAFDEAGRRFTWVKMTRPDAEGLRLALLDGSGSLQPVEKANPGDPNKHADYAIESITVRQAKYMGRWKEPNPPNPLTVDFNPWLNALIGGRGTGKSTLVDLCRTTLRRESELNGGGETSLSAAFDKRMRVPANRIEEGLLTPDTVVEVTYRKDGERFVLSWDQQGHTPPISRLDGDQRVAEQGDIRERFPVRIYSQKQLFDLAKEPNALLTVIDDSADVRGAELMRLRKEAETKYLSLCAEARALRAQVADLPARTATLADVRRNLEVLQQGGHAKTLNDYRARRRQDGTWESIQKTAADAVEAVGRDADAQLAVADLDLGPEADGDTATAALKRAHEQMRSIVANLQKTVLDAVEQALTEIEGVRTGGDAVAWRAAVSASEQEYQTVTQLLAEAGIANPDEYRDLLQRATTLEQEIGTLEKRRVTADEREKEAAAALLRYRELRSDLTKRRKQFADETSSDLIKVEVQDYAMRQGLEDFLRDALGIASFDADYLALVEQIVPAEGQPWGFEKLDERVARLRELLGDPQKQWDTKDRRFETALRKLQPERLDRVALNLPDDSVEVSFRDPRDGNTTWRRLAQGSPGQQTAALLAFVLGYGHEPIILDQPEDDLDNTLIYELLVRRLRERKPTRQVIVVTHNPNIVVHGDAELVVSLEARGGQTKMAFAGGLQEQKARDEICRVMEGGRDAFETRYRRIMLPGGRRDG